ncbi:hypothetical protein [Rhodoferax sp.]|uniref:hypothetical protein n=1 Tax=Rhodoferax sp. TaxID=50421 RepID=UPI0026345FEB|nr:hypothetical protein [Rhodoferax sp.]MDD2925243.1 hypothetical protein [Rhodoferax sp.]
MTTSHLTDQAWFRVWRHGWLALLLAVPLAHGQSLCSSDDQAAPKMLLERFVNADCDTCWRDPATPAAVSGTLALDWIVPGSQGEDAPLAAAARRDAHLRLEALQRLRPDRQDSLTSRVVAWPDARLRVAHGIAFGGYVGASIELRLPPGRKVSYPLQAWLALVETLPAGLEGSVVARNLVRNVLQPTWNGHESLSNSEQISFREFRAMNIPEGAQTTRLQVVGWLQDASGQLVMAAESACPSEQDD